jgi:hypothetical protein
LGSISSPNTNITVNGNVFLFAVWRNVPDEPASGQENAADLMVKFGIKAPGYSYSSITPVDVLMTFQAVHKYIAVVNPASAASKIAAGNYIDLRSLTVETSAINAGGWTKTPSSGGDLRLLVVGRNSFNGKHGNATLNHLVFRFAKSPGSHPYESALPRKTYLNSALRAYLLNQYAAGLQNAGVPLHDDSIVYTPIRRTGKANVVTTEYEQYTDKLWLPAAKEMGNSTEWGNNFERSADTAAGGGISKFEYYQSNPISGSTASENFWTSTPISGTAANDQTYLQNTYAAYTTAYNNFDVASVETDRRVAPAFCIK